MATPTATDIAIVAFTQAPNLRHDNGADEVETLAPIIHEALAQIDLPKSEIGFVCSGSSDYLLGLPFSFVKALDAFGPWPPIKESHVEMDGAWALYESWVRMLHDDVDYALVYAFGKSSNVNIRRMLTLQQDPYLVAPLWPDTVALAGLQARAALDAGTVSAEQMADVVARSRHNAKSNPFAQLSGDYTTSDLLDEPMFVDPLRKHDCAPLTNGASVVILAKGDAARRVCDRPAWLRGIDHRIEAHQLGERDLTRSVSTAIAAQKVGVANGPIDVAEIHAPFSHQEVIVADALGIEDPTSINPSGGALAANPLMTAGLVRMGEVARRIWAGEADRGVAHATSGAALQQNLVCVLEGE